MHLTPGGNKPLADNPECLVRDMHVKSSDSAQQRIGCNHPVALSQNLPGERVRQASVRVEKVNRGALPTLRFASNP